MELSDFVFDNLLCNVPPDWQEAIAPFLSAGDASRLSSAVQQRFAQGEQIFPPRHLIFNAMCQTPFEKVKAVIIGQDPYHEPGQAMGLSFAVPVNQPAPPSLRNIFQEYAADLGVPVPANTTLMPWAKNGVLLLNAVLTVQAHRAGSHRNLGWEAFTEAAIRAVSAKRSPVAFLLFGSDAQRRGAFIDGMRHVVFQTVHPSPLSAYRGFFGSRPFTTVNRLLAERGVSPIDWRL